MDFTIVKAIEILESTPNTLLAQLSNLSEEWITSNEGENTWSVKEVVAHLIICETTNWIVRTKIILSDDPQKTFVPIDMTAHFDLAKSTSLEVLLKEFEKLRNHTLSELKGLNLNQRDLEKSATHPKLDLINLKQLLATWVVHDLSHLAQVSRIMAKQYKEAVGPFITFLKFLNT